MISAFGSQRYPHASSLPVTSKKISSPQENRSFLLQEPLRNHYKAMLQDRVKSAKIIALQRRFSSCGNLGRQVDPNEMGPDNCTADHVSSSRSSSFPKAPCFVSSLYHSVEQNAPVVKNQRLFHSSSVESPPNFCSKRLRSGSCPQVWTSIKLSGQVSLHNNNSLSSINKHCPVPVSHEIKHLANLGKNSVLCFEKSHVNSFHKGSSNKSKKLNKSAHCISFGSSDSSLTLEKNETYVSGTCSSYEDLNEEAIHLKDDSLPVKKTSINNIFSPQMLLKRTVSTEYFNFPNNECTHKCRINEFSYPIGLKKFVRNSFHSNSDIYNLKSPVETKPTLNKLSYGVSCLTDSKSLKAQDIHAFHHKKQPNLIKTVSDQQLSSSLSNYVGKLLDPKEEIPVSQSISLDKQYFNTSNKNSIYVSSVFLNLSNSKSQKHESRFSSASPPIQSKASPFSSRPSTICPNETSPNLKVTMPTFPPPYSAKTHDTGTNVLKVQKEKLEILLQEVKEAVYKRDLLKSDIKQMESALFQNNQVLSCFKPLCVQELKRSNFKLKSDILKMTQYLDFCSEDNEEDADEDKFIFGCCDGQNWSYNPSYDGKR